MSLGWGWGAGELERGNTGTWARTAGGAEGSDQNDFSWFCLESKKPGELVVVFTNTANYRVLFFVLNSGN